MAKVVDGALRYGVSPIEYKLVVVGIEYTS